MAEKFLVRIADEHPPVPGYDVKYTVEALYAADALEAKEYTLKTDCADAKIDGNILTVPQSVWESTEQIAITAEYKENPKITAQYILSLRHWEMTFSDSFENMWQWSDAFAHERGKHNNPFLAMDPESTFIENGRLVLENRLLTTPIEGKYRYTGAAVSTRGRFSQKYGCFTAKAKCPVKDGILVSFWMIPEGRDTGDSYAKGVLCKHEKDGLIRRCAEIDVFEQFGAQSHGKDGHVGATLHFWHDKEGYCGGMGHSYDIPNFKDGSFHEYTCIWEPLAMYFYVDGVFYYKTEGLIEAEYADEADMVLSSFPTAPKAIIEQTGFDYNGWMGYMEEENYPQRFEVEFVRAYK